MDRSQGSGQISQQTSIRQRQKRNIEEHIMNELSNPNSKGWCGCGGNGQWVVAVKFDGGRLKVCGLNHNHNYDQDEYKSGYEDNKYKNTFWNN